MFKKKNRDRWIRVKNRLPEERQLILTYHEDSLGNEIYEIGEFAESITGNYHYTHWMPAPEPPIHKSNKK